MNSIADLAQVILKRDNFLLMSHAIPDGDSIGSLLGMQMLLQSLGKASRMVLQDDVPHSYHYLAGSQEVMKLEQLSGTPDTLVFLDCADEERVGKELLARISPRGFTINIDHHQTNTMFGDINCVQPEAAAACEIVYHLAQALSVVIEPALANALYAGIVRDTGCFRHSSTRAATLRSAAELLEHGVDLAQTRINLFESRTRSELDLLIYALNSIQFSDDGKKAWMTITYNDVKKMNMLNQHPEGIIDYTVSVKGVEVGMLFREIQPGIVKVGYRSKGLIDVAQLASALGGGGHRQAAGATLQGSMEQVQEQVLNAVREVII